MRKISKAQVLLVHERLLAQSGGSTGVRDEGLLESALATPYQEFAGMSNFPTIEEKAARLGFGIIKNHPFIDGNKRTGAHIMLLLLCINGINLDYTQDELIEVVLHVASGESSFDDLRNWIYEHKF
ncbi:MAG: type II toxin-antitoxin system death-on-curing family toxin [Selenomonas sp.]|nr:type II toxin-antitoxin system death-on-curing family toxin [Selenomonas sp.]